MDNYYIRIKTEETGKRIKNLMIENGYTVNDVQRIMGFEYPQAVYSWLAGKSLPSVDHLVVLAKVLDVTIDDILVTV